MVQQASQRATLAAAAWALAALMSAPTALADTLGGGLADLASAGEFETTASAVSDGEVGN